MTGGEPGDSVAQGDTAMSPLEARYERLLRWYPAGHQDRHGGEMLGVLLAAAGPGRDRPTARESANLIGGALRIRLRAATTGSAGQWRDALARAAVLLPLALLIMQLGGDITAGGAPAGMLSLAGSLGPLLVLVIAALAGWRRLALAAAAAAAVQVIATQLVYGHVVRDQAIPVIGHRAAHVLRHGGLLVLGRRVVLVTQPPYVNPGLAMTLSVLGVAALGLALARKPPGRSLATWRHYALTVLATAGLTAVTLPALAPPFGSPARAGELLVGGVIVALAIPMLAWSPGSRRLLAIAAVPLYFVWIGEFDLARLFPGVPIDLAGVTSADILLVWLPLGAALAGGIVLTGRILAGRARGRNGLATG